jgi:hypothetical protein
MHAFVRHSGTENLAPPVLGICVPAAQRQACHVARPFFVPLSRHQYREVFALYDTPSGFALPLPLSCLQELLQMRGLIPSSGYYYMAMSTPPFGSGACGRIVPSLGILFLLEAKRCFLVSPPTELITVDVNGHFASGSTTEQPRPDPYYLSTAQSWRWIFPPW